MRRSLVYFKRNVTSMKSNSIDSAQVTFVDGGYRTKWVVEIWIGFPQNKPPEKESTLNKNQVKILKNCNLIKL